MVILFAVAVAALGAFADADALRSSVRSAIQTPTQTMVLENACLGTSFVSDDFSYYSIQMRDLENRVWYMGLDMRGYRNQPGKLVVFSQSGDVDGSHWRFVPSGSGYYLINRRVGQYVKQDSSGQLILGVDSPIRFFAKNCGTSRMNLFYNNDDSRFLRASFGGYRNGQRIRTDGEGGYTRTWQTGCVWGPNCSPGRILSKTNYAFCTDAKCGQFVFTPERITNTGLFVVRAQEYTTVDSKDNTYVVKYRDDSTDFWVNQAQAQLTTGTLSSKVSEYKIVHRATALGKGVGRAAPMLGVLAVALEIAFPEPDINESLQKFEVEMTKKVEGMISRAVSTNVVDVASLNLHQLRSFIYVDYNDKKRYALHHLQTDQQKADDFNDIAVMLDDVLRDYASALNQLLGGVHTSSYDYRVNDNLYRMQHGFKVVVAMITEILAVGAEVMQVEAYQAKLESRSVSCDALYDKYSLTQKVGEYRKILEGVSSMLLKARNVGGIAKRVSARAECDVYVRDAWMGTTNIAFARADKGSGRGPSGAIPYGCDVVSSWLSIRSAEYDKVVARWRAEVTFDMKNFSYRWTMLRVLLDHHKARSVQLCRGIENDSAVLNAFLSTR